MLPDAADSVRNMFSPGYDRSGKILLRGKPVPDSGSTMPPATKGLAGNIGLRHSPEDDREDVFVVS